MAAVSLPRIKYHFAGLWLVRDFARSTIFECLHLSHISFSSKISLVEQNTHDTLKPKRLIPQLSVKIKFKVWERDVTNLANLWDLRGLHPHAFIICESNVTYFIHSFSNSFDYGIEEHDKYATFPTCCFIVQFVIALNQ